MKENMDVYYSQKRTDPLLIRAHKVLNSYSRATGALIWITDSNYLSIPEVCEESAGEKNACMYCLRHQYNITDEKNWDRIFHPCRELHLNQMKKAIHSGGSCCYMCSLGFSFWTSPVYSKKDFVGSLIGSGFLSIDKNETAEKMEIIGKGTEKKANLLKRLSIYEHAEPHQVKALAELMQVCAESISEGSNGYYKTMKRRSSQQKELNAVIARLKEENSGALPQSLAENQPAENSENTANPEDNGIPADAKNTGEIKYPMEKEKAFLEAVQCGDTETSRHMLNELLGFFLYTYPDQFKAMQFKILEIAILLSRMENMRGNILNTYSIASHQYLNSIEESENTEELIDTIHLMAQHLAGEAFSFKGIRHMSALKKADQFIQANFTRKLSLREIASASGLSAPYFCTIFKEEMGENLSGYLNRLRVEKASRMLKETDLSLNEISYSCGFEDQSWFSKIFKNYAGMNPGKFRQKSKNSEPEIPDSKMSENYRAMLEIQT